MGATRDDTARPVVLALGPTNTGKTHRAVTRMLEHDTGMIGLPLRLLAREVYDRVSRAVGEAQVALVTGEEKRVPRAPRYWVCTVEAMPTDRPVQFLAIDEVQLAAHRERGHVFTDRLLHARGLCETWLLGADTMAPLLRELLPGAQLDRQPRFSALRHAGQTGLGGLAPRSAVVAFTANGVYELAARMRAKKGGVAVVLGALSPRTRNAQVALYEAREVHYLVATDAIGMGLNLDVDHVAFASTDKFDGRDQRSLDAAEIGQIAGRAGRYQRDGTFGTLRPLPKFSERLVARLEQHRFAPVTRLVWRSAALDFASVEALAASLAVPPPHRIFTRVEQADDFDLLRLLGARPRVQARAAREPGVRLLWDVCQVPDYRKLLLADHAALLEEMFVALVDHGHIDVAWVEGQVRRIDRIDGAIEDLLARLAAIRVWTYVSHQRTWIGGDLGARTRAVEDRLSDALHERLVERFVATGKRAISIPSPALSPAGRSLSAQIGGLLVQARQGEAQARERWVLEVVEAPHEAFEIDDAGAIRYGQVTLGTLAAGRDRLTPRAVVAPDDTLGAGARARIERRLAALAKDLAAGLVAPVAPGGAEGLVRGILWQLEQGLGTAPAVSMRSELDALTRAERTELERRGVVLGRQMVFARPLLSPAALRLRALLVRVHRGASEPRAPPAGAVCLVPAPGVPPEDYLAMGFVVLGPRAIRVDVAERAALRLRTLRAPFPLPPEIGRWLGVPRAELPAVLAALGLRQRPDGWERVVSGAR